MKIEEAFQELEAIITRLEDKDTSLEDAFKEYEKGVGIVKECNDTLDKVHKQIIVLQSGEEGEE
ncbi:MAG: exodeoxyribonuclease VII small subunit [Butyrivibrio sp.]